MAKRLSEEGDGVGEVDKGTRGFSLGKAPLSARPLTRGTDKQDQAEHTSKVLSTSTFSPARTRTPAIRERSDENQTLYDEFKNGTEQGKTLNAHLKEAQTSLKDARSLSKVKSKVPYLQWMHTVVPH